MFIQVIHGRTQHPDELHDRLDIWMRDLRPGATGYLGSTGGVTQDGSFILIARFESREVAQRNSDRPEQAEWWNETEKLFDGAVTFHDTEDVHLITHGDMDSARFVQVMDGHVDDHDRAVQLEREADPLLAEIRPDLLGALTAYYDDDAFTEVAYFTSEAAARRGESSELPVEARDMLQRREEVMHVDHYLDITDPWLTSA